MISTKQAEVSSETDFSSLTHVTASDLKAADREIGGQYGISIVNTKNNGARTTVSKRLHGRLGNPETFQIATDKTYLYLGPVIPHSTELFSFSRGKGKNVCYVRGLVNHLTEVFDLDFSERTSWSFHDVQVCTQEYEGQEITYAKIKMV